MAPNASEPRQAVVVIHGIGEQRPMETLRGFVEAVLDEASCKSADGSPLQRYFSKPDRLSDTLELRRLASWPPHVAARTDFYELYWAHLMGGTAWSHVAAWWGVLMLRMPRSARTPVRLLWALSWAAAALVALLLFFKGGLPSTQDLLGYGIAGGAAVAVLRLMGGFGLHYVGDAARYLSPTPQNIAVRKNIRTAVIDLLEKLHDEPEARYDRIIVVGHSLGSVIAYDALSHLWQMRHSKVKDPHPVHQRALARVRRLGRVLSGIKTPIASEDSEDSEEEKDKQKEKQKTRLERLTVKYRKVQRDLLAEQQAVGIGWRISDLVTLGSPLAHAAFLLAKDAQEWEGLKRERTYPTAPPQLEDDRDIGGLDKTLRSADGKTPVEVQVLHHAALFACTRWTNLYFPGDLIGGPLSGAAMFGHGVVDRRLESNHWLTRWTPLAHVRYWSELEPEAVKALKDSLDLGDLAHVSNDGASDRGAALPTAA